MGELSRRLAAAIGVDRAAAAKAVGMMRMGIGAVGRTVAAIPGLAQTV